MYLESNPTAHLSKMVDSFWSFNCDEDTGSFKILPDNCTDIILDLRQNKAFFIGVMSNFQCQNLPAGSNLIGIRFRSERFSQISKVPAIETRNLKFDLHDIINDHPLEIIERLHSTQNKTQQLNLLEGFVHQLLGNIDKKEDETIQEVTKSICLAKGNLRIRDLAKHHNMSIRNLERRFKYATGLTPKEYSSVLRFNEAKTRIAESGVSLLEIAYESGYYDSSHMTKEFQRISGEIPSRSN